jgi:Domain of unknown function (DUF4936)
VQPSARRLFVYYRVEAVQAHEAIAAAKRMQAALRQHHAGLAAELLRRPAMADAQVTLMETYMHPQGIEDGLQAAIEAEASSALHGLIAGARHVEVFEPCA